MGGGPVQLLDEQLLGLLQAYPAAHRGSSTSQMSAVRSPNDDIVNSGGSGGGSGSRSRSSGSVNHGGSRVLAISHVTDGSCTNGSAAIVHMGGCSSSPPASTPLPSLSRLLPSSAPAPAVLRLHTLALVNVRGLSDALLSRLAATAGAGGACSGLPLKHLRLEDCYCREGRGSGGPSGIHNIRANASGASSCGSSKGGSCGGAHASSLCPPSRAGEGGSCGAACGLRPSFTAVGVLQLLSSCPRLLSLRLRHAAAPLAAGFVEEAAARCPLLQRVLLDQCDLQAGGFSLAPDAYSALTVVQVGTAGGLLCGACAE